MRTILGLSLVLLLPFTTVQQRSNVVTDARTGAPLGSSKVLFARVDGRLLDSIVIETDGQGRFVAVGVPDGTYRLFAEHDGYLRGEWTETVTVRIGEALTGVRISLTPTAVITGRVVTDRGEHAPKVYVRAHRPDPAGGDPIVVAETRTNDLGEYRLFGLAPGSYVVSAEPYLAPYIGPPTGAMARTSTEPRYIVPTPPCPDCMGEGQSMVALSALLKTGAFIDPLALTGREYPRLYFPDATELARAKAIEAEPGAEVTGIDFRLIVRDRGR